VLRSLASGQNNAMNCCFVIHNQKALTRLSVDSFLR